MPEFNYFQSKNALAIAKCLLLVLVFASLSQTSAAQDLEEQFEDVQTLAQDVIEDVAFKDNLGRDTPRSSFIGFLMLTEKFDYKYESHYSCIFAL